MSNVVMQQLQSAIRRFQGQDFAGAERLVSEILRGAPGDPNALHLLGLALAAQGRLAEAIAALKKAAATLPADPDILLNLANTVAEQGAFEEALDLYQRLLALKPGSAIAHFNIGNVHRLAGRVDEAALAFERSLAIAPDYPHAHNNLGLAYEHLGRAEEAIACYRRAMALDPGHLHARSNLGNVLRTQGRIDEAVACLEKVLADAPNHVDAHINLGNARIDQGRYAEASSLYQKVLRLDARSFEAYYNLGELLKMQGALAEAIVQYRHALDIDPRRTNIHSALGDAYRKAGDLDSALACFQAADELVPNRADRNLDLAETFKLQGRLDRAIEFYERALAIDPGHVPALGGLAHVCQHACQWTGIETLWERARAGKATGTGGLVTPFSALSMPTSAAEQLACAQGWARRELAPAVVARAGLGFDFSARRAAERLRIGYLSWGFHQHATAYLTAELFERHDRSRFEVFAYAYGPDDGSAIRARIRDTCEHFTDIAADSHLAAARRIYEDGVDILVDLTGYTLGARTQILALRPAPLQVNWLGYPGTMGAGFVDVLIADPFIIPPGHESGYAERIMRLPDCYQVNDRRREVSERVPSRAECGLPAGGIVFCCFNLAYKIHPETFRLWMRILRAVPGSVLWLAEANPFATENLRRAAAASGVAAERLVFAGRKLLPEYLVQYRLADLALDTFPYTSHTTASDALWMGCPLVTRTGETFASRVAGSVLNAAGLPELVTSSPVQYERLAIELAIIPGKLQAVRRKLQENRDTCPLFDTARFVRKLEGIYEEMHRSLDRGPA